MWTSNHRLPVRLEKVLPFQRHFLLRKAPKGIQQEEMPCESGKVYPMLKGSVNTMWIDKKSWFYCETDVKNRVADAATPD